MLTRILGVLLAATALIAAWQGYQAQHWKAEYNGLAATYNTKAAQAAADAAKETAVKYQDLLDKQDKAFKQRDAQLAKAQQDNSTYQQTLKDLAAKYHDEGHRCAVTVQPKDTLPGP